MKTHKSTYENHSKNIKKAFMAKWSFCLFLLYAGLRLNVMAQATIDNGSAGASALMGRIEGTGVTLANGTFPNPGDAGAQYGTFSDGINGAGLSVDSGIILSTGSVTTALSSNDAAGSSENTGNTYSDPDLVAINSTGIYDAAIFQFEITTGADVDAIIISYQFGSEEYPDYVCSRFNDAFGFFVSGPGISGTQNIALVPESGNVVAVNSVNGGVCGGAQDGTSADLTKSNYFIDNNEGTPGPLFIEFNGMTTLLNGRIENLTPNTTYTFKIALADVGDGSYDSGIIINQVVGYKTNSDNDGLDDIADLDDDNDGIDDIVEAGGNEPNGDEDGDGLENWRDVLDNNGVSDGSTTVYTDSDNNGYPDVYDTDGDGVPNHLDLDSDNDGCDDVVEAGFADADNDGLLGSSPVTSDAEGRVDGQGGYSGTNSYVTTAGIAGNITTQPVAESIMRDEDASFSVTATGDDLVYQWEEFNGSVWSTITNGGSAPGYAGATTSSLSITNIPLGYNGYDYRVSIASTSYACTDLISDEVNLEVLAPPSDAPVITDDFCVEAAGTVSEVSGSTTESTTNLTIRIYVANTETGTKSEVVPSQVVFSPGSWTAEGLSINANQWVFATAENVDLSEPEGDFSAGVQIRTKTPDPTNSLKITSSPVAGDATLEGEVLVSTTSAYVIQLYIDGVKIPGAVASVPQGALAAIGNWVIEDLDLPSPVLYANGIATVTMDNPDIAFCESNPSAGVLIACNPTNTIALVSSQDPSGCDLTDGSIMIDGLGISQPYTIRYKKDNVDVSTNLSSNASGEVTITGLNDGTYTDIYADLPSCPSNTLVGPVVLSEPTPATIAHQLSFNPTTCGGTDGYIRLNGLSGDTSYTVDYEKDGTPVSRTIAASSGVLTINSLSAGSYADISVTSSSCTSNVLEGPYSLSEPLAPTIIYDTEQAPASCSSMDGHIRLSGLVPSNNYDYQYTKDGSLVNSVSPLIADVTGAIQIDNLGAGTYTNISVIQTSNSCQSNTIPSIVLNPPDIELGMVMAPTTCGGTDGSIEISNLAENTTYDLDYQMDGSPVTTSTFTANGLGDYTISGLSEGAYTDIIVTNSGCVSNALSTTLSDPANPVIAQGTLVDPTTCGGTNGSIELTGLDVSTSYTVEYTLGSLVSQTLASDGSGNLTILNLSAGSYTNISVTLKNCPSNQLTSILLSDPANPTMTLGQNPVVCEGTTSGDLEFSATTNSPDTYSIDFDGTAEAFGFVDVVGATLSSSPIVIDIPAGADPDTYQATITVENSATSCAGSAEAFTVSVIGFPSVPTIQHLVTNDETPVISGSADAGVALVVEVATATYNLSADGSGNWSIDTEAVTPDNGVFTPNTNGANEVLVTAGVSGCEVSDMTADELNIDTTPPTVDIQDEPTVIVSASAFTVTLSFSEDVSNFVLSDVIVGNGFASNFKVIDGSTYTVDITPDMSDDVTIDVPAIVANDVANNNNTAAIQAVVPLNPTAPTVLSQITNNLKPIITGTTGTGAALDADETMTVTINGATYNVVPGANGKWSVDTDSDSPASGSLGIFSNGNSYEVVAIVEDAAGNEGIDVSSNEITIDTVSPAAPTVVSQTTNAVKPIITGTTGTGAGLPGDENMTVTVNGATYNVTPDASGNWSINTDTAPVITGTLGTFDDGNSYEVVSTVTDVAGNAASDASTNEVTIDRTAPTAPTIVSQTTAAVAPVITGTTGTGSALPAGETMTVEVNGASYNVTPDASGNWSVDTANDTPAMGTLGTFDDGSTYQVVATVTDAAGNTTTDGSTDEVVIDRTAPTAPTVNTLTSNDTAPVITGTTGTGSALPAGETMTVEVNGATYNVTPDASGNWSVDTANDTPAMGTLGTFDDGSTYQVVATVTDAAGNTTTDGSTDEVVIDRTAPTAPTVNTLTSNDTAPVITGTTGTGSALPAGETMTVEVNGATYNVTPDASGNWSVDTANDTPAMGTLGTFDDGSTYQVVATVTDAAGNTTTDGSTDEVIIDRTAPTAPTVNTLTSNDTAPVITGTTGTGSALPAGETMTVEVNGATYNVTPDASGNWSVDTANDTPAMGTLGTFDDGSTYQVVATVTDAAGNTTTDGSTDEVIIDRTAPTAPTVNTLTSNDTAPVITGTTGTGSALPAGETMTVEVNGATYNVTPDASGNWSVDTANDTPTMGTLGTFDDGSTYQVVATVTDAAGNTTTDGSTDEVVIDRTAPTAPTVNTLTSNDTDPVITGTTGTGTALPAGETMTVEVNGAVYNVVPDASGNWSVDTANDTPASGILGTFDDGSTYQVVATVTDAAGNTTTDGSTDEVIIDRTAPTAPTVNTLTSNDTAPVITGTTGTGSALPAGETMTVEVNGATYNVTPDASGNWSVDTANDTPAMGTLGTFDDGSTYQVVATVTDAAGNTTTDGSTDEVIIDRTAPTAPTGNTLTSNDTAPVITGTTGTGSALPAGETMTVEVNGATYNVTPDASGNWSVDTANDTPAMGTLGTFDDGSTYQVVATVTDAAGNTTTDGSTDEVVIDRTAPTAPTVNTLTSNDTDPVITGTTGTGTALPAGETMTVEVNGAVYNVVPDASGNWSVDTANDTPASGILGTFDDGSTYQVVATVTDAAGNTTTDGSTDEVIIDRTAPTAPTVNTLTSNDTAPVITGTTGTGSALPAGETMTVEVNGATYNVTPDASGNWSVDTANDTPAMGTLGTFDDGSIYQVVATVTDAAGNTTTDGSTDEIVINTNNNPVTVEDVVSTNEDQAITIDILANDFDPDIDPLIVTSASSDIGAVIINSNGTITVTPPVDYIGEIVVAYEISDGRGGTAVGSAKVTVLEDRSLDITMEEQCINDVPYVDYEVTALGFDPAGLTALVEWVNASGNVVQTLTNQPMSGRLLWPGAEVDSNGNGVNWPGWDFVDGTWVQVEDGLRNGMNVRISVNPENTLTVSYPPATPACAAQPINPFDTLDTDGDGVVDIDEDANDDGNLDNDDTDGDGTPDYKDEDDDGDGLFTIDEDLDQDGDPTNDDIDGDGIPNFLDSDDDGDNLSSLAEDTNGDGDLTNDDCDQDGIPNYLDADQCELPAKVLNNVISSSSPAPYNSLQIDNIEDFPSNTVQIFNRWGNKVWETKGYDNNGNAFFGTADGSGILGSNGSLPVGTYFYIVDLGSGQELLKGFVRVQ
ncbi:choice-of-anchor L domain-containing protein [Reichenbachiella carrageenanivorans]|uniref:Choice-of-anchor L domain-containing protein n=1 Tax=Reichenbachiella carrageenanivorans TaxID=2979869 RepID=A0ABY6D0M3_9BACT|nr:choice-of-anchor L domain-containing protein [Reichenbachiella carrageenanivorans]UXX79707.1 choice-of-anchor L domain-containing protein [Reichenbachiella carrageenanivorans]